VNSSARTVFIDSAQDSLWRPILGAADVTLGNARGLNAEVFVNGDGMRAKRRYPGGREMPACDFNYAANDLKDPRSARSVPFTNDGATKTLKVSRLWRLALAAIAGLNAMLMGFPPESELQVITYCGEKCRQARCSWRSKGRWLTGARRSPHRRQPRERRLAHHFHSLAVPGKRRKKPDDCHAFRGNLADSCSTTVARMMPTFVVEKRRLG